ncbi:hypothetical protein MPOCJGCO_3817 [Methylobacterium trifolii]|uniref:Uncharacterized protein n=1 Tax=Methylobacterium trifolii TaxID=1003092 RepID=A0ABQ4U2J3_9HYPH|nr:hypothetical protein MPOCJGCO_3817 [Methylobacterium trifolii]
MMHQDQTKRWHTPAELALACGCSVDDIEALTRQNHWPRVHGEHGQKIGVEPEIVRTALSGPTRAHGRISAG